MSFDAFSINCPHFAIGCCTLFKEGSCKYKYHKCCDENFLCNRYNCKYGHGISPDKRIIINNIYDEKYSSSSVFEINNNPCEMPMNCINRDCLNDHHLEYSDRVFIYDIVNSEVSDKEAKTKYVKKYLSPFNDTMSSGSTTPMITSFTSLLKTGSSFENLTEQSDDEITNLINEMILIHKDIITNNKLVTDIKDKIRKMENDLIMVEAEDKSGKSRLKELAIKIANIVD